MAEIVEVKGFDELVKGMMIRVPVTLRKMAFNVDANVAAEGRKKEQDSSSVNELKMGEVQLKRKKGEYVSRAFSSKNAEVGWVSNTRKDDNGKPFRMASFAWERAKKGSVTSPYSNQLANLWGKRTKPYKQMSPWVGRIDGTYDSLMRWHRGSVRPVKYHWSQVANVMASAIPGAIERTGEKFLPKLEKDISTT